MPRHVPTILGICYLSIREGDRREAFVEMYETGLAVLTARGAVATCKRAVRLVRLVVTRVRDKKCYKKVE